MDDIAPPSPRPRRVKASNLLWFISSRPYVPLSDLRRRFGLETEDGTIVHDEFGLVHIGLPKTVAESVLELARRRKIGFQFDLEFSARIVVGVYPMRVRLVPSTHAERADETEPSEDEEISEDDAAAVVREELPTAAERRDTRPFVRNRSPRGVRR